jgi:hypothetical protein
LNLVDISVLPGILQHSIDEMHVNSSIPSLMSTTYRYDERMSVQQGASTGRRKRTPLKELYPGFPYVDEACMTSEDIKARRFALNLQDVIEKFIEHGHCTSLRDFSRKVGIAHNMLIGYMDGSNWIDGKTLARLETMTGQPLWDVQTKRRFDRKPPFSHG